MLLCMTLASLLQVAYRKQDCGVGRMKSLLDCGRTDRCRGRGGAGAGQVNLIHL